MAHSIETHLTAIIYDVKDRCIVSREKHGSLAGMSWQRLISTLTESGEFFSHEDVRQIKVDEYGLTFILGEKD